MVVYIAEVEIRNSRLQPELMTATRPGQNLLTLDDRLIAGNPDAAGNQTFASPFTLAYDAENSLRRRESPEIGSERFEWLGELRV